MRFSALHKTVSYLMVTTAVVAVALGPDLSMVATALTALGIIASWFVEPPRVSVGRFAAAWNVATVVFFFYLVTEVVRGEAVITAGAHFLLFVLVNKLFNRRSSRDYLQAYVVSFLLMVVATTMNNSLSYAVCFVGYVLFTTWTLILFHLRREMEDNYLLKHSEGAQSEKVEVQRILNSRRIVGGSFLAGTSLVSFGIIVGAVLVFVLFPRIGFGLFLSHKRGGVAMAGFSERVELGHHGVVRDNPTVVMRVVPAGGRRPGNLRWRGSAFDHYDRGVWSHGPEMVGEPERVLPQEGLYIINNAPGLPRQPSARLVREQLLRQEIYLEPLDSTILFAADRPVAVELPRAGMFQPRRGPLAEIRASRMRTAGVHYVAYSHLLTPPPAVLRQAPPFADPALHHLLPRFESYLQLPRELPPRIVELARRITRDKPTVFDKVIAVQDYLRGHYRYTLKLTHDPRLEPVDEFLFVTRRGHCEYFASAMAILLRAIGIHSRSVNGFAAGEWNEFGKYIAVRQGDAHAWVEVLFSNVGWVTFDPTPSGQEPTAGATGAGAALRQLLDTLRMRWFRYVVEYDLRQQVSLLRRAQQALSAVSTRDGWSTATRGAAMVAGAALLAAIAVWAWRRRGRITQRLRGREGSPTLLAASQLYARLLALLARAGHAKPPGATPQEFVEALASIAPSASDVTSVTHELVARFTRCYYEVRYGGQERTQELRTLLGEVQLGLRRRKEVSR
jgi:protein-glutamine gamma-glutamyltransferase